MLLKFGPNKLFVLRLVLEYNTSVSKKMSRISLYMKMTWESRYLLAIDKTGVLDMNADYFFNIEFKIFVNLFSF